MWLYAGQSKTKCCLSSTQSNDLHTILGEEVTSEACSKLLHARDVAIDPAQAWDDAEQVLKQTHTADLTTLEVDCSLQLTGKQYSAKHDAAKAWHSSVRAVPVPIGVDVCGG